VNLPHLARRKDIDPHRRQPQDAANRKGGDQDENDDNSPHD